MLQKEIINMRIHLLTKQNNIILQNLTDKRTLYIMKYSNKIKK